MHRTKTGKTLSLILSALVMWSGLLLSSANAGVISSSDMLVEQHQFENKQ